MNKGKEYISDRREFLKSIGRVSIMGILVFIPAFLISQKRVALEASDCDIDIQCGECSKNKNCKLIKRD